MISEPEVTEEEIAPIVSRAQSGDPEAFDDIISLYQNTIAQQMRRFSRKSNEIEELVQNVFVNAYFSLKNYRAKAPFINWLRTIASRTGYAFWREQYKKNKTVALQDWDGQVTADTSAEQAKEKLEALMSQLKPAERHVLYLMYIDNYPVAQVSEITGWTEGMVKMRAYRARNKLKKILKEEEDCTKQYQG